MRFHSLVITLVLGIACSNEGFADDVPVYESLKDISVGRVFFTAAERERLDQLRGSRSVTVETVRKPSDSPPMPQKKTEANGFIIGANGNSRVYRDGDFVTVRSRPDVDFHDDVAVIRKSTATTQRDDDEDD